MYQKFSNKKLRSISLNHRNQKEKKIRKGFWYNHSWYTFREIPCNCLFALQPVSCSNVTYLTEVLLWILKIHITDRQIFWAESNILNYFRPFSFINLCQWYGRGSSITPTAFCRRQLSHISALVCSRD